MRLGKVLLGVLGLALFLMLLSALVVSPAPEAAATEPAPLSGLRLMPLSMPSVLSGDFTSMSLSAPRFLGVAVVLLIALMPALSPRRDANGRVLRARRYVSSFYQLFRQEVAGG